MTHLEGPSNCLDEQDINRFLANQARNNYAKGQTLFAQGKYQLAKQEFLRCTINIPESSKENYDPHLHYQALNYLANCRTNLNFYKTADRAKKDAHRVYETYLKPAVSTGEGSSSANYGNNNSICQL